jgi:energy-coupling factor transport system permease protein
MIASGYIEHFQSNSPIARLDARVKLIMVFSVLILVFAWNNPIHLGCLVLVIILLSLLGGVPLSYLWKLILISIPFGIILTLIHGFFNKWFGTTPLLGPVPEWVPLLGGHLTMFKEGTLFGLGMAFRTFALMLAIPMVISTTDMNKLVLGLIDYHVPYKITFVFTMALRFAPLLIEEMRAIQDAQRLRGLDTSKMKLARRVKVSAAMVVPLILGTMMKSTQLEIALQAKAFSGSNDRTYLHEIKMTHTDWLVGGLVVGGTILAVLLRIFYGFGGFTFISVYAR